MRVFATRWGTGRGEAALRRLTPLPAARREGTLPLRLLLSVALLQVIAYLLVLLPMGFGFNRFEGLELVKYQILSIANALAAPAALLLLLLVTRSRLLVLLAHLLQLFAFLAVTLYVAYFEAFPHLALLRQIRLLPPVAGQVMRQLVGAREVGIAVALLLSCALSLALVGRLRAAPRPRRALGVLVAVVAVLAAKDALLHTRLPIGKYRYDGVYFFRRYGFLPILGAQLRDELRPRPPRVPWPGPMDPDACRVQTFPRRPANILVVQVESLDPWVIAFEVEGEPVMPFLRGLRQRCLSFANFFSQHRGGGSADAELACLTGLLPLGSHTGFLTADFSRILSLPQILATAGYYTCALHANAGSYFYRKAAFRRLGFQDFFDRDAFHGEAAGWHSQDRAFFRQALALLERAPRPVFAYLITMQSHGPFTNHAPTHRFDRVTGDRLLRDYLAVMAEVDEALATLVGELERRGEWNSTILVLFGDHPSGVPPPGPPREEFPPVPDRIPLLLSAPELASGVSPKVGSPLDLGPTLLHLAGLPDLAFSLGTSLLDEGAGRVLLSESGALLLVRNREPGSAELVLDRNLAPYLPHLDYSESVLHP